MSVIIRLQNLPWSANALDIRQYFSGLSIPEGGVHIVGGELGDAFIAFSTDEDARQAFLRNNGKIKEIQINLMLSSRTEMQKVIEEARNQSMSAFITQPQLMTSILPSAVPDFKKSDDEKRRKSRSRSKERRDRYEKDRKRDRRRDHSRSKSRERSRERERNRDRRRRDRSRSRDRSHSRSRDRDRKPRRSHDKQTPINNKESRVGVWEAPPGIQQNTTPANSANLLANFVANNILPNILNRNIENNAIATSTNLNQRGYSRWDDSNQSESGNFQNMDPRTNFQNNSNHRNKDNKLIKNCCIKLHPFYGGFGGIRRFFNGLFIQNDGIKFINDDMGKRTGIVYVKFAYPSGKEEALGRSGDKIRNQSVMVEHLDDEEFINAIDRYTPDGNQDYKQQQDSCLVIKSLPEYAKEDDIYDIFSNYSVDLVIFQRKSNNISAYIRFSTNNDAMNALDDVNVHVYDGYPLKIESCLDETFERIKNEMESGDNRNSQNTSNTIIISNLPKKCSDRDIIDFFSDIGVMPANIHLVNDDSGYAVEATCEFYSVDDAILGYQKNGMPFGNSTISMKYKQTTLSPQQSMRMNIIAPHMNITRPPFFLPRNNFGNMGPRGPPRPPIMGGGPMGPRGMGGMRRFPTPLLPHIQNRNEDNEELAPPGCVLLMENVPYKAGLDEILVFLDGYDVSRENVLRKYNPNGLPSGETKVIFNSPDEVFQVIQDKRGARIRDRTIYMTQV